MTKFTTCVSVRDANTAEHAKLVARSAGWKSDAGTLCEHLDAVRAHRAKLDAGEYSVAKRRGYWICSMTV